MATLDVSFVPGCTEFSAPFQVIRRREAMSFTGRPVIDEDEPIWAVGTIYPTGDNRLVRQADFEHGNKTLTVVTTYRLQTAVHGFQPDIVCFRGNRFVVTEIDDFSQYGYGFVVAICTAMQNLEAPPLVN